MNKTLTISIAAYNVENYIRRALDSLVDEDIIDDLEIFVIDDGGTDNTLKIAQEFADKYPNSIFLIHKENGGYGSTINTGIKLATGKYFKQLDGDDWFDKGCLKVFVESLKHIKTDCVLTSFSRFYEKTSETICENMYDYIAEGEYSIEKSGINDRFSMYTTTYLTQLLKDNNIQLTEQCFYTDIEYSALPIPFIETVYVLHVPLYVYRMGDEGQSMSVTSIKKHYKEHSYVYWNLLKIYNEIPNPKIVHKRIFLYILRGRLIEHFKFLCLLPISITSWKELNEFRINVETKCMDVLIAAEDYSQVVKVLIKTHLLSYPIIRIWVKRRWMKK